MMLDCPAKWQTLVSKYHENELEGTRITKSDGKELSTDLCNSSTTFPPFHEFLFEVPFIKICVLSYLPTQINPWVCSKVRAV